MKTLGLKERIDRNLKELSFYSKQLCSSDPIKDAQLFDEALKKQCELSTEALELTKLQGIEIKEQFEVTMKQLNEREKQHNYKHCLRIVR